MKYFSLINLIIFLCIAFVAVHAQNNGHWEILHEGMGEEEIGDIDFVNENTGWIAGRTFLLRTEDGGNSWKTIYKLEEKEWNNPKIDFVNEENGWIVDYGELLKTADGGQNWRAVDLPKIDAQLNFCMLNDSIIYVIGYIQDPNTPGILKTVDGGVNWIDISFLQHKQVLYKFVQFIDEKTGIIIGRHWIGRQDEPDDIVILSTTNGGENWQETRLTDFTIGDEVYDLHLIDDSTAYFFARKGEGSIKNVYLYASSDNGKNWSVKAQNLNTIFSSYFQNNTIGHLVMLDTLLNYNIWKTTDGGLTWDVKQTLDGSSTKIYFSVAGTGFVLSNFLGPELWKSADCGDSWKRHKISHPLNDLWFFDKNNGLIGGGASGGSHFGSWSVGMIFGTNNGGNTLNDVIRTSCIKSLLFVNDSVGYRLDMPVGIFKTDDGGLSWTEVNHPDSNFTVLDICFNSEENGWALGGWADEHVSIMSTKDGGDTWNLEWRTQLSVWLDNNLGSIFFVDSIGWALAQGSIILKHTNQHQWQKLPKLTDLPLKKVYFSDKNHGWITGGYSYNANDHHPILFKTRDGGTVWNKVENFDYIANDIFFQDSLHGWIVGHDKNYSGTILQTVDGGEKWNVQVKNLSAPLNAIHFNDGCGWAVGKNGLVLRTEDGSTWIDEKNNKVYPSKFKLSQNYPNPFNNTTMINYQLPQASQVDLSIYNILGQKVATLVSDKQPAGNYRVEWDASGFASGIYFYSLSTDQGFFQIRKLIFMK